MQNKTWLDKEKLLEIAQSDGEVTLTSEQVELLFEENAKLVKALEWYAEGSQWNSLARTTLSEIWGGNTNECR